MSQELLNQIIAGTAGVTLAVSAADLRDIVNGMFHKQQEAAAQAVARHRENPTLTREQAAKALNVSLTTLWRWDNMGYLKPVKIGAAVLYRASDIEEMLQRRGGEA